MSRGRDSVVSLNARTNVQEPRFGARGDDTTDDTAALQNAIDNHPRIEIPDGIHRFSAITIPRNRIVYGFSRNAILKHTGAGTAITFSDASATDPDGTTPYIDAGWAALRDLQILVNGTKGIEAGKTRSSFLEIDGVYMRHLDDGGTYKVGATAFSVDNDPWISSYSTYMGRVERFFVRGFETAVKLKATVNAWWFRNFLLLECLKQFDLDGVTTVDIDGYMESSIAAARGIVFGANGGNSVGICSTFEFTNAAANSFAYDFSAGGTWRRIRVDRRTKYLLQGDGDAVEGKKYTGTVPTGFVEERDYLRASDSLYYPLYYTGAAHHQHRKPIRVGGVGMGTGQVLIGRSDVDNSDATLEHDGTFGVNLITPAGGFILKRQSGTEFFKVMPFSGAVRSLVDGTVVGAFTMDAAASKVVSNGGVTANSRIFLMPTNAAAATLMAGANSLYISAKSAGVSFTVATAGGGAAAGTETFNFLVLN